MPAEVLEYIEADEGQAGTERVLRTPENLLCEIATKAAELKAAAEESRDSQTIQLVDKVTAGLQSRVGEVFAGGSWKDVQHLEKKVGNFEYTFEQARKRIGKEDRRNRARDKRNGVN